MFAEATLRIMSTGLWSDRMGGEPAPYRYVDLYDPVAGQLYTWSIEQELEAPEGKETVVVFELRKEARPALTRVKQGERAGQTMDFVRESLKVKVVGFGKGNVPKPSEAAQAA